MKSMELLSLHLQTVYTFIVWMLVDINLAKKGVFHMRTGLCGFPTAAMAANTVQYQWCFNGRFPHILSL